MDIKKFITIVSEADVSRRGFIKGASTAAASAMIPSGAAGKAIKALSSLPAGDLQILNRMLGLVKIDTVMDAAKVYLSSGITSDLISGEELRELGLKLAKSKPGADPMQLAWEFIEDQYENGTWEIDAVSQALGRPIEAKKLFMVFDEHNIRGARSLEDFFENDEVYNAIQTAYRAATTAVQAGSNAEADVAAGEESAAVETEVTSTVRGFIQRALGILSGKKFPNKQKEPEPKVEPVEEPKQLPAPQIDPSADELSRIQTLSGIKTEK